MFGGAAGAAAEVKAGEVIEVGCAGEVGVGNESLADGGKEGGEIGG